MSDEDPVDVVPDEGSHKSGRSTTSGVSGAGSEDPDKIEHKLVLTGEFEDDYDSDAVEIYDGHFTYYRKKSPKEVRWEIMREKGPDNFLGWLFYVCLLGPEPGPVPDPNEPNPYRNERPKRYSVKRRLLPYSVGQRRDRAKERPMKEMKEKESFHEEEIITEPAKKPYKQKVFEAVAGEDGTLQGDKVVALAQHLGAAPDRVTREQAEAGAPKDIMEFYRYVHEAKDPMDTVEDLSELFKPFDRDASGTVSDFAVRAFLESLGDDTLDKGSVDRVISRYSRKGRVNYKEMLSEMLTTAPAKDHLSKLGVEEPDLYEEYKPAV
ncbi:MAG: uncharacterized protein KVP18_002778 [Porospora cf. gigantea A]|nr:MAG: hypothetical protein KVP18_002778 [Porospora cf. gigantea A]